MKHDVVIIGSGLGGLQCAYILAKHGLDVCVLERNAQMGGCLQSFMRRGVTFDTGFHYVGGLSENGPLRRLLSYFGLMDLPWQPLDAACFDEVCLKGISYPFATGHEAFVETLSEKFPSQHDNLKQYDAALRGVGQHLFDSLHPRSASDFYNDMAFSRPAYTFLQNTVTDATLRSVLAGTSLKLELDSKQLPFYVYAQINNSFVEGAARLHGGGQMLVDSLCDELRSMGVTLVTDAPVVKLAATNRVISAALTADGRAYEGRQFISDVHPAVTLQLIDEKMNLRKVYRNRICSMENTRGMFTVNLALKPGVLPYLNRNLFVYASDDMWHVNKSGHVDAVMVSYACPPAGSPYAHTVDLLTPMSFSEVAQWQGTRAGHRGADYEKLKMQKAEQCIALAERRLPGLRSAVDHLYTSTPLSYLDYTSTPEGSAYGLRKDCGNVMLSFLTPKTPIDNLYLTGQNLNLHGVLGVSMTAFFTCSSIIGLEAATEGL